MTVEQQRSEDAEHDEAATTVIYRLYCLPLFPHWDHLARRLDTP